MKKRKLKLMIFINELVKEKNLQLGVYDNLKIPQNIIENSSRGNI